MKTSIQQAIAQTVKTIRETNPLAGSITNSVTINFVANAQLASGGSAAMVYLPDEGETLVAAGGSLYINVGTLLPIYEETLPATVKALKESGKPWVLDPVAVGIGSMRTKLLQLFKEYKPTIIRGNASEVIALAGLWGLSGGSEVSRVRGVDSSDEVSAAKNAAVALAAFTGGAVAVSGEVDLICDAKRIAFSSGGSHFMGKITGAGCALGGVMAVYASCTEDPFVAALGASAAFNIAGSRADWRAEGPGSYQVYFLDELYKSTPEDIANNPFELEEI